MFPFLEIAIKQNNDVFSLFFFLIQLNKGVYTVFSEVLSITDISAHFLAFTIKRK